MGIKHIDISVWVFKLYNCLNMIHVFACPYLQRAAEIEAGHELESAFGYEGYGAKARDGNGPREVEVWHHGENV